MRGLNLCPCGQLAESEGLLPLGADTYLPGGVKVEDCLWHNPRKPVTLCKTGVFTQQR